MTGSPLEFVKACSRLGRGRRPPYELFPRRRTRRTRVLSSQQPLSGGLVSLGVLGPCRRGGLQPSRSTALRTRRPCWISRSPLTQVHVVDNASSDGTADMVRQQFPRSCLHAVGREYRRCRRLRCWTCLRPGRRRRSGLADGRRHGSVTHGPGGLTVGTGEVWHTAACGGGQSRPMDEMDVTTP